jgi:hypothetical protein
MIIVRFPVNMGLSGKEKVQFEEFPTGKRYLRLEDGGLLIIGEKEETLGNIAPHTWVSVKVVEQA